MGNISCNHYVLSHCQCFANQHKWQGQFYRLQVWKYVSIYKRVIVLHQWTHRHLYGYLSGILNLCQKPLGDFLRKIFDFHSWLSIHLSYSHKCIFIPTDYMECHPHQYYYLYRLPSFS